jgi:hypothetical protein
LKTPEDTTCPSCTSSPPILRPRHDEKIDPNFKSTSFSAIMTIKNETQITLIRQFETAWKLTQFHLDGLTTEECLWWPAWKGLHVHQSQDGGWLADWPDQEGYDIGPPSIAWLTWHIGFWWSMTLNYAFGDATLTRQDVLWPGEADGVRTWIGQLQGEWRAALERMTSDDLQSSQRTRWPFQDRPFRDVIAWVSIELTKNAAEIGYVRFLFAVRGGSSG